MMLHSHSAAHVMTQNNKDAGTPVHWFFFSPILLAFVFSNIKFQFKTHTFVQENVIYRLTLTNSTIIIKTVTLGAFYQI